MSVPRLPWVSHGLPLLLRGEPLPPEMMTAAIESLTTGDVDEALAAALLTGLAMKGESAGEIAAAVRVLRCKMVHLNAPTECVIDTCGTGGDGSGTFNISTAVALVTAGAGCAVVKHGNRSVSSRSGSADVLAQLGVPIEKGPAWSQECLDRFGFAFCFAPHFHPCLAYVGPLRRKLGFRTIFNLIGPLLNPASASHQLLGVGKRELLEPLAGAVNALGTTRAYLVCSDDGLDEVSLSAGTHVREVTADGIVDTMWNHRDFGLEPARMDELKADGPVESAAVIRHVLAGEDGAPRRIVLANAAAALLAVGRVATLPEGVAQAAESIDSGRAASVLARLAQS